MKFTRKVDHKYFHFKEKKMGTMQVDEYRYYMGKGNQFIMNTYSKPSHCTLRLYIQFLSIMFQLVRKIMNSLNIPITTFLDL